MPVYSMTGYAAVQSSSAHAPAAQEPKGPHAGGLGLEIRSVNSRFLDLAFRLPEELRQYEPGLRECSASSNAARSKCAFPSNKARPGPWRTVAQAAAAAGLGAGQRRAWLPHAQSLRVADVLRMAATEQSASHDWGAEVLPLAAKGPQGADAGPQARRRAPGRGAAGAHRRNPGAGPAGRAAGTATGGPAAPALPGALERSDGAGGGAVAPEAAQDRALAEATAFAIRIDVAEEITRLGSHLDELERLIRQGGEIGKRLDFLIQELHREANTMGAKSAALA
jgi:hypothetical protein